jgi:hypothetical protein
MQSFNTKILGVLKYFRLQLPRKYRNEEAFDEFLNVWLTQVHFKVTNKKILKYEKSYELFKRLEKDKEDPQLRVEKENKILRQEVRRLEQENDSTANEFLNYRVDLNRKYDDLKDLNDSLELEISKIKQDQIVKYADDSDSISKYQIELDNMKNLYRSNVDNYEFILKQNESIRAVNKKLHSKLRDFKTEIKSELGGLFDQITLLNVNPVNSLISDSIEVFKKSQCYQKIIDGDDGSLLSADVESQIKELEMELARRKFELVNEKFLNQDLLLRTKQLSATTTSKVSSIPSKKWFKSRFKANFTTS